MIDPVVERQYADTKQLLALWQQFYEFFEMARKGEGLTPDKEDQFLELKSQIAMVHDSFMDALTRDQNVGQNILDIVTRSVSLKHLNRLSVADQKKMELEWHESYLLLTDTVAELEEKRAQLATMSEAQYRAQKAAGVATQRITKILTSTYLKVAIVVIGVLFGTVGVQVLGIWDWDRLGDYPAFHTPYRVGKKIYRTFNPDSPWRNIAVSDGDRAPTGSTRWPAKPEIQPGSKEQIVGQIPVREVKDILSKATEYRLEQFRKGMEGVVEIHTFLLPSATDARQAVQKWEDFLKSPAAKNYAGKWVMIPNVNVVTLIKGENDGLVNHMRAQVYGGL
ncbi:MAG: hypothetical protein D6691_02505 [Candidatus Hydrogenedentota bacterium]|jgi:hypothetical protein|uniref:Uncharacterized protein n=1 Tax=Sumerlaea chitinivorans TaxID=2250252 RepID=A0A2Z4Y5D6_SUMC1|nr:hypothetical protein BRCON_1593 [Candidatus Sumerlaea chitinivorans]RMH29557.1 MAG: hypothetical protein D6691_02505 [Candidatus Hydrogenedentota bacterium]GIX45117.1 MAG: hypothetical protein KatS3mg130_1525 [Candidatus Sumerlaea sp.]